MGLLWDALIYIQRGAESELYRSWDLDEVSLPWELGLEELDGECGSMSCSSAQQS